MQDAEKFSETSRLPAVWIEQKTKGEITFGVHVPAETPMHAANMAKAVFLDLQAFVKKLQEGKTTQ